MITSMASFSFVVGALLLQFTVVSQFATVYVQIIKSVFLGIVGFYCILVVLVASFSFMTSHFFALEHYQDRVSSFLFTMLSFAQSNHYLAIGENSVFFSSCGVLFMGTVYLVMSVVFNFLPSALVIEGHRYMQIVLSELKERTNKGQGRRSKEK